MELVWRIEALQDLDQIRVFIGENDPAAAKRVPERIRATPRCLIAHPMSGRAGRLPDTREIIVTGLPYVLAYRIVENQVEMVAVRHTSRRWPKAFDPPR